jgi:uncharacterized damage-inducible protein DinB
MTSNEALAHALTTSQVLLQRYTADLSPQEFLHRPASGANCTAWLIGHLTLSERRMLALLGVTNLPALPDGYEKRFSRDEGSPQAGAFGDVSTLVPLFNQHRERVIAAVKSATQEQLDKPMDKPHPMFSTVGQFLAFMAVHAAMHAGQITIIRRSLGRPPLV